MSDLISRQAAIDALRVAYWDGNIQSAKDDPCIVDAMTDWAIRQVKALPPAQPEQQWIPCSERLPDVDELVLVTDDSGGIKTVDVDRCGQYDSGKRFWYYTRNVVAWMPLPESYQEGEQDG